MNPTPTFNMPGPNVSDWDDSTVPLGELAPAAPRGVHGRYPCDRETCRRQYGSPPVVHAAGFEHVYRPPVKKSGGPYKAHASKLKAKRAALDKARRTVDAEPYPAGVLVPCRVPHLTVYSKTPWAWTTGRDGVPKPKGACTLARIEERNPGTVPDPAKAIKDALEGPETPLDLAGAVETKRMADGILRAAHHAFAPRGR